MMSLPRMFCDTQNHDRSLCLFIFLFRQPKNAVTTRSRKNAQFFLQSCVQSMIKTAKQTIAQKIITFFTLNMMKVHNTYLALAGM